MTKSSPMTEFGPVYGVRLIDSLPIGNGSMLQAMPSRADLDQVREVNERVVAGYEVLLGHFVKLKEDGEACECGFKDVNCAECGEPRSQSIG